MPAYTLPPDQQKVTVQRIIVRHGLSVDMADLLLNDFRSALTKLESRPPSRSLDRDEGTSYNHDAVAAIPSL